MKIVKSSRHTGVVVKDLESSLAFYRDLLGLELVARSFEKGPYIENVVGIPGAVVEWVKLKTPDGYIVELLQYHSHPDGSPHSEAARSNRLGCSHLAFTVTDIGALIGTLTRKGFRCNSEPQTSPDGKVRIVYAHDPDGTILELVEEIQRS